ncbi:MAG: hypothetical protein ABI629_10380 [bacterium]
MHRFVRVAAAALALAAATWATPAWAPYHVANIEQVFFGTPECPNAQYVMLRTLAGFQVFVDTQTMPAQTADGSSAGLFGTFTHTMANTAAGVRIIMGTAQAAQLFGLTMDEEVSGHLVVENGRICFGLFQGGVVDCVAYGDYTGDNGIFGDPATAPSAGQALSRIAATGNNAGDFASAAAAPFNNAGASGTLGSCGEPATPTPTDTAIVDITPTATAVPGNTCFGDCNGDGTVSINELITLVNIALDSQPLSACPSLPPGTVVSIADLISAVNNALNGCPSTPTPTATLAVPTGTASATATKTPGGPLGVRHFSLNPATSGIVTTLAPGFTVPSLGMTGFLELSAGAPDPSTGVSYVDITDASEYFAVSIPSGQQALCIRVLRDQLPVRNAGLVACYGGGALGLDLTLNHHVGQVGTCQCGAAAGEGCGADGDCPGGVCFDAQRCADAGGTLEGVDDTFPGVCRSSLDGRPLAGNSGIGALLLSPDPVNGTIKGVPAAIINEGSLPCGDEPDAPGYSIDMAFTTGTARGRVVNYNNLDGETLETQQTGENFNCGDWTRQDGPGTMVLASPMYNLAIGSGAMADAITTLILAD